MHYNKRVSSTEHTHTRQPAHNAHTLMHTDTHSCTLTHTHAYTPHTHALTYTYIPGGHSASVQSLCPVLLPGQAFGSAPSQVLVRP